MQQINERGESLGTHVKDNAALKHRAESKRGGKREGAGAKKLATNRHKVNTYLTHDEQARVKKSAVKLGITPSQFIALSVIRCLRDSET